MKEDMREYLDAYLKEAEELLQGLNFSLLKFEKNPDETHHVDEIARCAHTLKSSSAAMGFDKTADLAHSMEDVLRELKAKGIKNKDVFIDTLFICFDTLESAVDRVSRGKEEPEVSDLIQKLEKIRRGDFDTEEEATGITLAEKPHTIKALHSIKVDVEILDRLMEAVGELLITTMGLQNLSVKYKIPELDESVDRLKGLTDNIQYEVTEARMIPVGQVFNRFPRMVRDISKREGKMVEFVVRGSDIKLDRTILDQIGEPLIHLLRNAVDHGIEPPKEREKLGKKETGRIELTAKRAKNTAIIQVRDDGRGFNIEKIKDIAIRKGIINPKDAEKMSRKNILELPFLPEFSTAEKVTDVSGRGVGLDVVKSRIEELSGSVYMDTEEGKGTRITLELPLTLAIIKCLLVTISKERYAMPIMNVSRIVKVKQDQIRHIEGNEMFILDGNDIPLIRLRSLFDLSREDKDNLTVVIVEKGGEEGGLEVDSIIGEQELIIKSLTKALKRIPGVAGATILGDGYPAIVLDVAALI